MNYWHSLPAGKNFPKYVNVVVEIPRGSRNKYEYDKATGVFRLDRVLFSPVHYPGDYGFIPRTFAEDGDPLDALVLVNDPTSVGVVIEARPLGVLYMKDEKGVDEKILCVPKNDPFFKDVKSVRDLPPHYLDEVAHFFDVYKTLEGKKVKVKGWRGPEKAEKILWAAKERYQKKFVS
jgi:inorganic pyrophosphatase